MNEESKKFNDFIYRLELLGGLCQEKARAYPWKTTYKAFPGPNSNTFTAWIAKQVPELDLDLPFSAIGSGYAADRMDAP